MKYIIDAPSNLYKIDGTLRVPVKVGEGDLCWYNTYLKAESYTEPDRKAIEDAQEKAWELASAIVCPSDCNVGSIQKHCKEIFGVDTWEIRGIFTNNTYQEAKTKYEAWVKQKDEIHVGDEVTFEMAFGNGLDNNMKALALDQAATGEEWCVLTENGCIETHDEEDLYKTGRHFDEVAELLEKMRGE